MAVFHRVFHFGFPVIHLHHSKIKRPCSRYGLRHRMVGDSLCFARSQAWYDEAAEQVNMGFYHYGNLFLPALGLVYRLHRSDGVYGRTKKGAGTSRSLDAKKLLNLAMAVLK